jgi:hypothetical protein
MWRVPVLLRSTPALLARRVGGVAFTFRPPSTPTALRRGFFTTTTTSRGWKWGFRFARAARVVFLSVVLMQAGYSIGVTEVLEDPEGKEKELVKTIVEQSGATTLTPLSTSHDTYRRVERVAVRVVEGGQLLCERKRLDAQRAIAKLRREKGVVTPPPDIAEQIATLEAEVAQWEKASKKLKGEWKFIVLRNGVPNAFVTDLCPRRIFINTGLIDTLQPTDAELALVLGHELSHLILKHTTYSNQLKAAMASAQLVLCALVDPTGFFSLGVDWLAAHRVGGLLATHRSQVAPVLRRWSVDENLWRRRAAIISQLRHKGDTDFAFLTEVIRPSLEPSIAGTQRNATEKFFLRKAIGWALRAYSDADAVAEWVAEQGDALSGLSRREALKHL